MLNLIERTNLYELRRWDKRRQPNPEFCPERVGDDEDSFIYYEPWRRCTVSEDKGTRLGNAPRPYTHNSHPTGWCFDSITVGLEPKA